MIIEVRGHTGSKQHNQVLPQHRAESVPRYLKDHGMTNSMTAKGYGEAHCLQCHCARPPAKPPRQLKDRRLTLDANRGQKAVR